MSDAQPMKPQETVIYLLGELKGEMRSTRESVAASAATQAVVNGEHAKEHEAFRKAIEANTLDLAAIKAAQPIKVSPWSKAGIIIALPASIIALIAVVSMFLNPSI